MIGCQRIPLTEVRDIFSFRIYLCQYIYALSYQYFQFMYTTCIYLSYHCLLDGILYVWGFVCVCCAAPDKLTSLPPFTGLGALHFPSSKSQKTATKNLSLPFARVPRTKGSIPKQWRLKERGQRSKTPMTQGKRASL